MNGRSNHNKTMLVNQSPVKILTEPDEPVAKTKKVSIEDPLDEPKED